MEIRSLYLFSHFFAVAFVLAWLARLGLDFFHWSHKAGFNALLPGQKISLKSNRDSLPWNNLLLSAAGLVFGWVLISWIKAWFVREWLLLILPALAFVYNDLRLRKKDLALLPIYALIVSLHEQRETGKDFIERLIKIVDELPPGEIQEACRESIQRWRSGLSFDRSFQALSGLHPILDELVFTLRLTGWQASPALDLALGQLAQRAGRQWDRLSRWMVFREQIQPFLWFSQMAILAAILYLVIAGVPAFTLAWLSFEVIAWIGLVCILAAGILCAAYYRPWLRRVVVFGLLVASSVTLWQYASLPRLFELKLHSATHITQRVSDKLAGWEAILTPAANPKTLVIVSEEQNNTPVSVPTATPTAPSVFDIQSRLIPISSQDYAEDQSWVIPCCQPR